MAKSLVILCPDDLEKELKNYQKELESRIGFRLISSDMISSDMVRYLIRKGLERVKSG